eukprot:1262019-Pyramimonas_sp.AAC.1
MGCRPLRLVLSPHPATLPVYGWGDWRGEWGSRVHADGSGLAPSHPGLTRWGLSVIELDASGIILRAVYGGLTGAIQMVPRAEFYASLVA